MCGHWLVGVGCQELFGVAMISSDQRHPAGSKRRFQHSSKLTIHRSGCGNGGRNDSGVSHHVAVGEIQHDEVIGTAGNRLTDGIGNARSTHLRLKVVGWHFR